MPVLPIGPVYLDDPDAGRGQVPGQARAVTAGALDADQGHMPEPAQPVQQAAVPSRGGGEFTDAEQPANGVQRGRDVRVGVSVHAAGNGACVFYDGHCRPLLWLRDGTHPLAVGPVNPGLLHRPGRSDRQRRWVPKPGSGRQGGIKTTRDGVGRFGGQAGPRPDPTPTPRENQGSRAEALSTSSLPRIVRAGPSSNGASHPAGAGHAFGAPLTLET